MNLESTSQGQSVERVDVATSSGLRLAPKQHFAEKKSFQLHFYDDAEPVKKIKKIDIGGEKTKIASSVLNNQNLDVDSRARFENCVFNNCTFNFLLKPQ